MINLKTIDGLFNIDADNITIAGDINIPTNAQEGKLLTSDDNGLASWEYGLPVGDLNTYFVSLNFTEDVPNRRFTSIKSAADHILTLPLGTRRLIKVYPGTYIEVGTIEFQSTDAFGDGGVSIESVALVGAVTTIFLGAGVQNFFILNNGAAMNEFTIFGNEFCVNLFDIRGNVNMRSIVAGGCVNVFNMAVDNTSMFLIESAAISADFTLAGGFPNQISGHGLVMSGENQFLGLSRNIWSSKIFVIPSFLHGNPFNGFSLTGNSHCIIDGSGFQFLQDVFTVSNNFKLDFLSVSINDSNLGIKASLNSDVRILSMDIRDSITTDIQVSDSTVEFNIASASLNSEKIILPLDKSKITLSYFDINVDSPAGIHILGTMNVGSFDFPTRSNFGGGGATSNKMFLFKYDGVDFIDVSDDLRTSVKNPVILFDNLTSDIFYIGFDDQFGGIIWDITKELIETNLGDIVGEFFGDPVSNNFQWRPFTGMNSKAISPYSSYANKLWSVVEKQENRVDILCLRINSGGFNTWAKTTINGVNAFFTRYRINSPIIQSPILKQIEFYGNTTIIDEKGVISQFGLSRVQKTLFYDISLFRTIGNNSTRPQDQDIFLTKGLSLGRTQNSFRTGDLSGSVWYFPVEIDTSSPLNITIAYSSDNIAINQATFDFIIRYGCAIKNETQIYLSQANAPVTSSIEHTVSISMPVNQTNGTILQIFEQNLDVSDCRPRDLNQKIETVFFMNFERDNDSNSNNCVWVQIAGLYITRLSGATFI